MNFKTFIFSGIMLFFTLILTAQKTEKIELKNIQGVGYSDCLGTSQELAVQNAKQQAMNKAGITENIQVQTAFDKAEIGDNYSELFNSNVFTQMQGTVSDIEITEITQEITNHTIATQVNINCTVIKYMTESDPMFQAKVEGILPFYSDESLLSFSVIPSMNCYMITWLFTETEAFILFPNALESTFMLSANDTATFPRTALYRLNSDGESQQINRIIMVIMKENYPYMGKDTYKDISEWIFSLPPDQRIVKYFSITVTDE